jgi:ABC-type sugar transport system ATPase subunit
MNVLPARTDGGVVWAGPFRIAEGRTGLPARLEVGVRPENVRLVEEGGEPGEVIEVEPLGAETHLLVRTGGLDLRAVVRGFGANRRGDQVGVGLHGECRERLHAPPAAHTGRPRRRDVLVCVR